MADDAVILDYIIKAQDQAKGLMQAQLAQLQQLSAGITALVANQNKAAAAAQTAARATTQQGDALDKLIAQQTRLNAINQKASQGFSILNASLNEGSKLNAMQTGQLRALGAVVQTNTGFMQQHGQAWTNFIGQVKMGAPVTTSFMQQLQTFGSVFDDVSSGSNKASSGLQSMGAAATAVSAAIGAIATGILHSFVSELEDAVKQASLFQATFKGLGTIAKAFGQDMDATTAAARELAADGLMSVRDTALTLKNLIASGFNLEQAINLAKGFKDIASFNRQASLDLGYAVTSASEGIKNQNSLLVDNAGLTKNLTIILKEMGLSEQDLSKVQSDVNVRTMLYNGLLKEMGQASGDAARYTETFAGSQSQLAVNIQLLEVAIGDRLLPMLTKLNGIFSEVIQFLRSNDSVWGNIARTVAIATAAFVAFSAIIVAIAGTFGAVYGALALLTEGLVGTGLTVASLLTGIGELAAILALVTTAFIVLRDTSGSAATEAQKHTTALDEQRVSLEKYRDTLLDLKKASGSASVDISIKGDDSGSKKFQDTIAKLKEQFPHLNIDVNNLDSALAGLDKRLADVKQEFLESQVNADKLALAAKGFTGTIEEMQAKLNGNEEALAKQRTLFQDLTIIVGAAFADAWKTAKEAMSAVVDFIKEFVSQAITGLFADLDRLINLIERIPGVKKALDSLRQGIHNAAIDVGDKGPNKSETQAQIDALKLHGDALAAHNKVVAEAQAKAKAAAAADAAFGQMIKGQISTVESFHTAAAKLQADLDNAVAHGMDRGAAMRLPEIVKQSKELMSAFREGVGSVDANARAIEQRGKIIERQRRIEQEAIDHTYEYSNRLRALSRAFVDQTVGVDSLAQKQRLLDQAMSHAGVTVGSTASQLKPFQALMEEIIKMPGVGAEQFNRLNGALKTLAIAEFNRQWSQLGKGITDASAQFDIVGGKISALGGVTGMSVQELEFLEPQLAKLASSSGLTGTALESVQNWLAQVRDRLHEAGPATSAYRAETEKLTQSLRDLHDKPAQTYEILKNQLVELEKQGPLTTAQAKYFHDQILALAEAGGLAGNELAPLVADIANLAGQMNTAGSVADANTIALQKWLTALQDGKTGVSNIDNQIGQMNIRLGIARAEFAKGNRQPLMDLVPALEEIIKKTGISDVAFRDYANTLGQLHSGPLMEVKKGLEDLADKSGELELSRLKNSRQTADTLIRIAQLSANKQIEIIRRQKEEEQALFNLKPPAQQRADRPLFDARQDALTRQQGQSILESRVDLIKDKPGFEKDKKEILDLFKRLQNSSGKALDEVLHDIDIFNARLDVTLVKIEKWHALGRDIDGVFKGVAQTLASLKPGQGFEEIGKIAAMGEQAAASMAKLGQKLSDIKTNGFKAGDIGELASLGGDIVAGLVPAIHAIAEMKSGLAKTLAGANLGKDIGGMIGAGLGFALGGPAGAAIGKMLGKLGGALVGGIIAHFHTAEWEKVSRDVAKRFGSNISDELAKAIAQTEKDIKAAAQMASGIGRATGMSTLSQEEIRRRAEVLNTSKIIEEQGGITAKNIQAVAGGAAELLKIVADGGKLGKQALDELNSEFKDMADFMDSNLNGIVTPSMLLFINTIKQSGVEVKAVTDFLKQMADAALEASNAVATGFAGRFAKAEDLTSKIIDMTKQRADIETKLADLRKKDKGSGLTGKDAADYLELQKQLRDLDKEFERAKKEAQGLNTMLADPASTSQERFDRIGRLLGTTFDAAIASGKTFLQAIQAIVPGLEDMQHAAEVAGFHISDSLQNLIDLGQWAKDNEEIANGITGLNTLMKSLQNQGMVTQETFNDFGAEAAAQFNDIIASGQTADNAYRIMAPSLQTIYELQKRFGYEVDASTQNMLDNAKAAGVVGDAHMSAQERMVAALDKVVNRLDLLLTHFGVALPAAADAGAAGVEAAGERQRKAVDAVGEAVNRAAGQYAGYGSAAEAAAAAAQTALENAGRAASDAGQVAGDAGQQTAEQIAQAAEIAANEQLRLANMMEESQRRASQVVQDTTDKYTALGEAAQAEQGKATTDAAQQALLDLQQRIDETKRQYGDVFMQASSDAGDTEGATGDVTSATDDLNSTIDTMIQKYNEAAAAAQAFGQQAYAASHAATYGHSPGGIDDLILHLQTAVNSYYTLGSVASGVADDMVEKMKGWADTLQDLDNQLTEETLDGLALQMFKLNEQKVAMIKKFMKDMEGASQDLIDAGLATIDQIFAKKGEKAAKSERDRVDKTVKDAAKQLTLSAKVFEQTLTFMHDGILRTVALATPSLTASAYSPQRLSTPTEHVTVPASTSMPAFDQGFLASPQEPRIGIFGEKRPEMGGSVEFMKNALVGAMKESGVGGGSSGDIVLDFRHSNITDKEAFSNHIKDQIVPVLKTLMRQNYRQLGATTSRNVRVKT